MTYLQMRTARLTAPVYCPCGAAAACPSSDFCAVCKSRNKAAQARTRRIARKEICLRLTLLVLCLFPFSVAVGVFCPAFLQPLVVLAGLLAAIPLAAVIAGGTR